MFAADIVALLSDAPIAQSISFAKIVSKLSLFSFLLFSVATELDNDSSLAGMIETE